MPGAAALPGVTFTTTLHAWLAAGRGILNLTTAAANLAGELPSVGWLAR